jgi:hypothetical protein
VHSTVKILDPGRFAMGRIGRAPRRAVGALVVILGLCGIGLASATPVAADPFHALAVPVDATAQDVNLARANALTAGYRAGLDQVFERLVLAENSERTPQLSDNRIAQMVSGFEILDERVNPIRYRAILNINFNPDSVRLELRNADVRFAETPGRAVVVLPVLSVGPESMLWQTANPWVDAWERSTISAAGLVPLILPAGDDLDVRLVGIDQALAGDGEALDRIAERYGAREALSAIAEPSKSPGDDAFRLDITLLSRSGPAQAIRLHLDVPSGPKGWGSLFDQAVAAVAGQVNAEWKQANVLQFDQQNTMDVTLTIARLADWLDIRGRLETLSVIRAVELRELSQSAALLRVRYLGTPEGMAFALRHAQLDLEETSEGWKIIRLAPAENAFQP